MRLLPASTLALLAACPEVSGTPGAYFPAFAASVVGPAMPFFTAPAVKRGSPVTVTWPAMPGSGTVRLVLTTTRANGSRYVYCVVPDAAGSVTVGGALTALLESAPEGKFF